MPRAPRAVPRTDRAVTPRDRIRHVGAQRNDELDALAGAQVVLGVGGSVPPEEYAALVELTRVLDAELGATRKVTDRGWLPRSRQIGITGRNIQPELYIALGISGKFNHMVGVRGAGIIVAVNHDPHAPIFDVADLGVVGDWREVVPRLARAVRDAKATLA
jgi:electron transfer flavoprotein alpha subunit